MIHDPFRPDQTNYDLNLTINLNQYIKNDREHTKEQNRLKKTIEQRLIQNKKIIENIPEYILKVNQLHEQLLKEQSQEFNINNYLSKPEIDSLKEIINSDINYELLMTKPSIEKLFTNKPKQYLLNLNHNNYLIDKPNKTYFKTAGKSLTLLTFGTAIEYSAYALYEFKQESLLALFMGATGLSILGVGINEIYKAHIKKNIFSKISSELENTLNNINEYKKIV